MAYDTWIGKNSIQKMDEQERIDADNLDQLFWFYPLQDSEEFVQNVFNTSWQQYQKKENRHVDSDPKRTAG